LNWQDNSPDEEGFVIERAASAANPTFSEIGRVSANVKTWTISNQPGTFVFRVRSTRTNVNSDASNDLQIKVR